MSEEKRRIAAVGKIKDGPFVLEDQDIVSVPKAYADKWIKLGWAKDAKTGETGQRDTGTTTDLEPDNISHPSSSRTR